MKRVRISALGALIALVIGTPLRAQEVWVNTPGNAFTVERGHATLDDVAGGRRVRGKALETVILRGVLRIPAPTAGEPKVQRLVVRFRGSEDGPSLRSVEL